MEYKKLNELTNEDLKDLELSKCELRHNISKDYGHSYTCETLIGDYHLKFQKNFNELVYYTILGVQGIKEAGKVVSVNCYRRWTKGISKNGSPYYQVQLIFGKQTFLTRMISNRELALFNIWVQNKKIKPINWIEVPESLGIEDSFEMDLETE